MTDTQIKTGVYNCPNCGAAATPDSVRCAYCHSGLATLVCSSCFGAIFTGMKHCPWCGEEASAARPVERSAGRCPRCHVDFLLVSVGRSRLNECPACGGLWVDTDTLSKICSDHEQQETVIELSSSLVPGAAPSPSRTGRMYIPCPECKKLMNRRQFAGCSGVIVDWCKAHGTWFDRDELKQIIEFIAAGGLIKAREREKTKLEEERRSLREEQRNLARIALLGRDESSTGSAAGFDSDLLGILGGVCRTLHGRPKAPKKPS